MVLKQAGDDTSIRVIFRTDSPLAMALVDAERSRREPLLRHLAEEFLRMQREGRYLIAVDPTELAAASTKQLPNPISVKLTITGTSELDQLLRALPHGNWSERRHRIDRLRMLAESGLAVIRSGRLVDASAPRADSGVAALDVTASARSASPPPGETGKASWGMPIALDDSNAHDIHTSPAFDLSVVMA